MRVFRRGRFLFWAARELSKKYTKSLILGIILGFILMVLGWKLIPLIRIQNVAKTMRIGLVGEYTPSTLPLDIQKKISFGLTTIAENGTALPGLAEKWEATDEGKLYTFHLKHDVHWHDGKEVTAKQINYNIANVEFLPIDEYTLQIRLPNAFSPFPTLVSKPLFGSKLLGFGEYKVSSLRLKGDKITFLRLVSSNLTERPIIEYRFYRSEAQAIIAYDLGEIDMLPDISTVDASMEQWQNTTITKAPNYSRIITLYFNTKDSLTAEKSVRQMLAYAVPDLGLTRAFSPIHKKSWAYTEDLKHYDYNLAQAKKLLTATGVASTSGEIIIHTFSQYVPVAQTIAKSWQELGLSVAIRVENVVPDTFQVLLSAMDIPTDPDQYSYWHSTQTTTNISGISNAKIDKLLEDGRIELNAEKREKLYIDFQKKLIDELPALFLYYPTSYTVTRNK